MTFNPKAIFERSARYEGVRPINIYLLRLLYVLMFFVLGEGGLDAHPDARGNMGAG